MRIFHKIPARPASFDFSNGIRIKKFEYIGLGWNGVDPSRTRLIVIFNFK